MNLNLVKRNAMLTPLALLNGGKGDDKYSFEIGFGKDTIRDSDGIGSIRLDSILIGTAKGSGQRDHWKANVGGTIVDLALINDSNATTEKRLIITRENESNNAITIENFDLNKARRAANNSFFRSLV